MRELPGGSIVPVAQGVDTFIRPRAFQQAPGLPRLQPFSSNVPQLRTIQQGSGGNVQGFNQWAQLAGALAPFNDALTKTAMAGGQMYAQGEYEKGRNDAIRAQILANQQREQGGAAYAAETRRLEGVDPEAARLMDRVNPFRQAGRDNQRARLAANEAKTYILQAYRENPDAKTWAPGDPRLSGVKVQATQQILERFGLDQNSAGFQDYVNPEIAQAWDRVSTEQWEDYQNFQKDTVAPMAAVELMQIHTAARADGRVDWTEFDPTTGRQIQRSAALGTPEWRQGLRIKLNQALDRIGTQMGLRGETTEHTRRTVMQLVETAGGWAMAEGDPEKLKALGEIISIAGELEVGPPGRDGRRTPAGIMYAPDFLKLARQQDQDRFELQARAEAQAMKQFGGLAAETILQAAPGTPEYEAAVNQLLEQGAAMGIPADKVLETIDSLSTRVTGIAEHSADPTEVEELFIALEAMDPAGFDTKQALDILRGRIAQMPPEMQAGYLKRLGSLAASKGREAQNSKGSVINPILNRGIAAALRREYPKTVAEAALRGVKDIQGFMAYGDANLSTAATRLEEGARKHMQARLAEAATKAGRRLTAAEETAAATAAFNEYLNTKDEGLREYLFPGGASGGPGIQGGQVTPPQQNTRGGGQAPALPPGRKANPVPVVSSSNLDNVDPKTLQSGAVVLNKPSTLQEVERVLMGQTPSAAVRRAARAAGMPVGQWLLRQADGHPGSLTPGARQELLRRTNQGQAAGQKVSSSARPGNPYGKAAGWLADLLLGTRPAMASQGGGGNEFPFSRGQFPEGLTGRGNGYTPIRNVIVTSALDPESPGFDMAIEGGRRGAPFRWPFSFRVVDMEVNRRENNMERTGNRSDRFYGTNVTLRFRSPVDGREYDVISAHHDKLNPALRRGGSFPAGTFIGTQGRTGSTTGTHTSLDVYVAGTRRPAPMAVRTHLRDGFAKGSTFGNRGGYSMPARGAMTGKATFYTGSGGSDGVLGGKTANGETFTGRQMTAAVQWSLKPKLMNKWLIVEDVGTGRRIRVWANDTGQMGGTKQRPADRLIDLSPVAFTKLFGSTRRGVGNIRVTVDPNQRGKP